MNVLHERILQSKIPAVLPIWDKIPTIFARIAENILIMDNTNHLVNFFKRIQADPRISATHIGIFAALNYYRYKNNCGPQFQAFSREIMRLAKISSSSTYHKCILELNEYGYLTYKPSFSKTVASSIHLAAEHNLIAEK
ncbi:hypothetical protein HDF26_002356 [Pedobacter cryoconitis]|uniref:hypothetical protein n=1 Tax=Pedobacter cryoconitis TaxID=188932 RepID=UPI0017B4A1FF|nr:hypothetical protein [Pedobacter cryoconitis]MBB6271899.1 hypothetical protein [Pedobacter cryoconitis]